MEPQDRTGVDLIAGGCGKEEGAMARGEVGENDTEEWPPQRNL